MFPTGLAVMRPVEPRCEEFELIRAESLPEVYSHGEGWKIKDVKRKKATREKTWMKA